MLKLLNFMHGDSALHVIVVLAITMCFNAYSWHLRSKQRFVEKEEYYDPVKAEKELKERGKRDPKDNDERIRRLLPNVTPEKAGGTTDKYAWIQTEEEVEIKFFVKASYGRVSKSTVSVDIGSHSLSVGIRQQDSEIEEVVVDGPLFAEVEKDDCAWLITTEPSGAQIIEVFLTKTLRTTGKGMWSCIVRGEPEIDVAAFGPIVDYIEDEREEGGGLNGFSDLIN
jgi:hypothetical protein